jgi:hypothetical protein
MEELGCKFTKPRTLACTIPQIQVRRSQPRVRNFLPDTVFSRILQVKKRPFGVQ